MTEPKKLVLSQTLLFNTSCIISLSQTFFWRMFKAEWSGVVLTSLCDEALVVGFTGGMQVGAHRSVFILFALFLVNTPLMEQGEGLRKFLPASV